MSDTKETVKIVIPTEKYTKTRTAAGGASHHNGDAIASVLAGATLEQVYEIASAMTNVKQSELVAKYEHLNAGQQRMNLGNRIRGAVNKIDGASAKIEAKNAKIEEANKAIDEANAKIEAHNAEVEETGKGNSKELKPRKPLIDLPEVGQSGIERLQEVAAPFREEIEARIEAEAAEKAAADEAKAKAAAEKAAVAKAKAEVGEDDE